jgi:lysozyme family protein
VPGDNGGETYAGITRKNFPDWDGWNRIDELKPLYHGQVINDELLSNSVVMFYKREFWNPIGGDQIESQDLANQVFDMAVNAGVGRALQLLKQS